MSRLSVTDERVDEPQLAAAIRQLRSLSAHLSQTPGGHFGRLGLILTYNGRGVESFEFRGRNKQRASA